MLKYLIQVPSRDDINHVFYVYSCILRHQEVFQEPSKTLQKGVWEGVQNAVLRRPQTGIYRVLHGWSMYTAQYPVMSHVVCTPAASVHRYPTVATCNDTSIHYIRVYSCVYTSLHRILHTHTKSSWELCYTGRTCAYSVGILRCTVGTPQYPGH